MAMAIAPRCEVCRGCRGRGSRLPACQLVSWKLRFKACVTFVITSREREALRLWQALGLLLQCFSRHEDIGALAEGHEKDGQELYDLKLADADLVDQLGQTGSSDSEKPSGSFGLCSRLQCHLRACQARVNMALAQHLTNLEPRALPMLPRLCSNGPLLQWTASLVSSEKT